MTCSLTLHEGLRGGPVRAALIWARGMPACPWHEDLPTYLAEVVSRAAEADEDFWPVGTKARVRDMLRYGKYKPAGRSKPASEFLLKAAVKGGFPAVNPPVDVNNFISLSSGLPGSIFDTALSGEAFLLRRGEPGERYVFNRSGQEIDLQDLLLVCRREGEAWFPCGNPVKDSMDTKTSEATRDVMAVLYAPSGDAPEGLSCWAERFAEGLKQHAGAAEAGWRVVEPL